MFGWTPCHPSGELLKKHIFLLTGALRTVYTKVECITESWSSPQARDRCKIY